MTESISGSYELDSSIQRYRGTRKVDPPASMLATPAYCSRGTLNDFRICLAYFFTHSFFASSHFMSEFFSQSALVLGGSAAKTGAAAAETIPSVIAKMRALCIAFTPACWI